MKTAFFTIIFLTSITASDIFSQQWTFCGSGFDGGANTMVYCMVVYNNELYVGGNFDQINGISAMNIAKFNGSNWSPVGDGLQYTGTNIYYGVRTLYVFNSELYAGGNFNLSGTDTVISIAKWTGSNWVQVGTEISSSSNGTVFCLKEYNNELYAGGSFPWFGGNNLTNYSLAKWDGYNWTGSGNGGVYSLETYNNLLYIGGQFDYFDSVFSPNLIIWDGNSFFSIGSGTDQSYGVRRIMKHNNNLVIAGVFTSLNGVPANNIAQIDILGTVTALGSGLDNIIYALSVYDNQLVAGGSFLNTGSVQMRKVSIWDGSNWCDMGGGFISSSYCDQTVTDLIVYNDTLYAGGAITRSNWGILNHIAKWNPPQSVEINRVSNSNISIYPNPLSSGNMITIECPMKGKATLNLLDIAGRQIVIENLNLTGGKLDFQTPSIPQGVYYIKLIHSGKTYMKELCIE